MDNDKNNLISYKPKNIEKPTNYTLNDAIKEFDEIKNLALSCCDKNGNPNISIALKAIENKAKLAGLYKQGGVESINVVKMSEITIDGEQLKLNIGEEFLNGL